MNSSISHTRGWMSHSIHIAAQGVGEDLAARQVRSIFWKKRNHRFSRTLRLAKQQRKSLVHRAQCAAGSELPRLSERPSLRKGRKVSEEAEKVEDGHDSVQKGISDFLKSISAIGAPLGSTGYESGDSLYSYFGAILAKTPIGSRVPAKQARILYELLKHGHALADEKIGVGVKYIFADRHKDYGQKCFMIMRKDNTTIDFSYRKCLQYIITNEWQKSPPKVIALMNTARQLYISMGSDPQVEMQMLRTHARSTIDSILNIVQHSKDCAASTLLAATRGLGFCVLVNEEVLTPVLEAHESFQLLLRAVHSAALELPLFYSVLQLSSIERFASNNTMCGDVCSSLTRRVVEAADELHAADCMILLKSACGRPAFYTRIMPVLESLGRKLRSGEIPITAKLMRHLTAYLFEMQWSPNEFLKGMDIKFIETESNDSANCVDILNRFMLNKCYPGPVFLNRLIGHTLVSKDSTIWSVLTVWNAVITFSHKLPPYHLSLLGIGLSRHLHSMSLRDIAKLLWGFGYLGLDPPVYYECVDKYVEGIADSYDVLDCLHIPLCLWSLTALQKYNLSQFKFLWATASRIPQEQLSELALASLFQVYSSLGLEDPDSMYTMPSEQVAAAFVAWENVVQQKGASLQQLDIFQTCQEMGLRASKQFVLSPGVYPLDIALLPPNYEEDKHTNVEVSSNTREAAEVDVPDLPLQNPAIAAVLCFEEDAENNELDPISELRPSTDFDEDQLDDMIFQVPDRAFPEPVRVQNDHPGEVLYKLLHNEPPNYDGSAWYENNPSQERTEKTYQQAMATWLSCDKNILTLSGLNNVEGTLSDPWILAPSSTKDPLPSISSEQPKSADGPQASLQQDDQLGALEDENPEEVIHINKNPVVAINVDCRSHFLTNSRDVLGQSMLRTRLLKKLGCTVVTIVADEWSKLTVSEKHEHIRNLLEESGVDPSSVTNAVHGHV